MFRFFFRGEPNFFFWVNEVDERSKKVDLEGQKRKLGAVEVDHNKARLEIFIQKFSILASASGSFSGYQGDLMAEG